MPATHTFTIFCARLTSAPVYVRSLQRRFGLPILAEPHLLRAPAPLREKLSPTKNEEPRTKNAVFPTSASPRALRGGNSQA